MCVNVPSPRTHGQIHIHTHVALETIPLAGFRRLVVQKGPCTPCKCMSLSLPRNGCHRSDGILAVASIACRLCWACRASLYPSTQVNRWASCMLWMHLMLHHAVPLLLVLAGHRSQQCTLEKQGQSKWQHVLHYQAQSWRGTSYYIYTTSSWPPGLICMFHLETS